MEFSKVSGVYKLKNQQFLPVPLTTAWNFFANPSNLQSITPENLDFKITSLDDEKTYPGQIITYSIKLNRFIKMNWITEITHVKEENYFVDEQRFGPYKMWHHLHKFESIDGGVMMIDIVHFKLPFRLFSSLGYHLFIKNKLKTIFKYRQEKLEELIQLKLLA